MSHATFRFYAELNDFLPAARKSASFVYELGFRSSVKDMIESLGVPHTEVELIIVNGVPATFAYIVQGGDRIAAYPAFHSIQVPPEYQLRPPIPEPCFVADVHLGRLASYLRMLGLDTAYRRDAEDADLAHISSAEVRILLTRDRGLLKRGEVVYGYFVRDSQPRVQLTEVIRRFGLLQRLNPFTRCMVCNAILQTVAKATVRDRLLPKTERYFEIFAECPSCCRVYWGGSHYQRMRQFIGHALADFGHSNAILGAIPEFPE